MIVFQLLLLLSPFLPGEETGHHGEKSKWSYNQTGPADWGALQPDYALCGEGLSQSPIDLAGYQSSRATPPKPRYEKVSLDVENNGHTIQQHINYAEGTVNLVLNGKSYRLLQFHFHAPSEHTTLGKHHAMELHLVHQDESGALAVIGVFMNLGEPANEEITRFWKYLPKQEGRVALGNVSVDPAALLPGNLSGMAYSGSLTTPPCSQGVSWYVLKEGISVTRSQVEKFLSIIGPNNRPIQAPNGRVPALVK